MPRIRTIKPSFFKSEDVSALPLRARLTWIGLWTHCDDAGRAKDNVRLIKGEIWPLDDVSLRDVEEDLETLADHGRIVRYSAGGKRYLAIVNWNEHQRIQKPTKSQIPPHPPAGTAESGSPTGKLPEESDSAISGKGRERNKEGKGKERGEAAPPARAPAPARTREAARASPPRNGIPVHPTDAAIAHLVGDYAALPPHQPRQLPGADP